MKLIPRPRTLGLFVIMITALGFAAGQIRNELGLKLLGVIFFCILAYCFFLSLILGLVHRKKALSLEAYIAAKTISIGGKGEIRLPEGKGKPRFFSLPGAIIRYKMKLETRDGRRINCSFNPSDGRGVFNINERGAYSGRMDEFLVSDVPGFFSLSIPVAQESGPRLLAAPLPAPEPITLPIHPGGTEQRIRPHYRKTDDLTDHRPYVPGDDPRRIKWKLYSHGPSGELFVREGEAEPPPHGKLLFLIDTQTDAGLFSPEEGRRGIDLLCETALASALDLYSRGIEVYIGYTGGNISGADGDEPMGEDFAFQNKRNALAAILSCPASLPVSSPDDLPGHTWAEKPGVLILALPRTGSAPGSLDRFLQKREAGDRIDIIFLYSEKCTGFAELEEAAGRCVRFYRKKTGINVYSASL